MSNKLLVQLEDVSVGYPGHLVLSNLRLELAHGSFTALLGTNGSGKSTLLKTLVGVLPARAGRVLFSNNPTLGYVPQRESLDPVYLFNCLEVVLMGTYGRVAPGKWAGRSERDLARDCLRATGALELASRRFSQLSGGQKQRVLIARALATRPDFLVLDEPTAGIDTAASQSIMELLVRLHGERKITILIATHDLPHVRQYIQDAIWVHQGKITHGPTAQLLAPGRMAQLLELF